MTVNLRKILEYFAVAVIVSAIWYFIVSSSSGCKDNKFSYNSDSVTHVIDSLIFENQNHQIKIDTVFVNADHIRTIIINRNNFINRKFDDESSDKNLDSLYLDIISRLDSFTVADR